MSDATEELEQLWRAIPQLLEDDKGWALRQVLESGVAGTPGRKTRPKV